MKSVYHPPPWGRKSWPGFFGGVGLAAFLFLLLPLTQYFASTEMEPPENRRVETFSPPPLPPPPEEREPPAPAEPSATRLPTPEPARPDPPPLSLRELQLALDPEMGSTAQGAFAVSFDLVPDGMGGIDVFEVSDVDQPPRPVSARPPRYPHELRRAGISGSVDLVFVVDRDGTVRDILVERSDHRGLELPAIEAVRTWRFTPGKHDGQPARVRVRQTLQFQVQ